MTARPFSAIKKTDLKFFAALDFDIPKQNNDILYRNKKESRAFPHFGNARLFDLNL